MTQAVALGVTSVGALGLSLGTSGVAFAALAEPQPGSFRHVYDDTWLALDSTHAAGLSMTWISRLFEQEPPVVSAESIGAAYIAAEQAGWSAVFDAQASADEAIAQPDENRRALTAERRDRFSSYASRLREG